jgi:hypothetical protein
MLECLHVSVFIYSILMSLGSGLRSLLAALQVPAKFSCHDIAEGDATISLEEWKITSTRTLAILKEQLERDSPNALTLPEEADLLSTLAAFDGNEQWISPDARILSRGKRETYIHETRYLVCEQQC